MPPTERFTSTIAAMFSAFSQQPDEASFMAFWLGLADVPIEKIEAAVATAIREGGQFKPSPAELRRTAIGGIDQDLQAELAWSEVRDAMRLHGYYHSVDFTDKAINATIRLLGGWCRLCEIEDENDMKFYRIRWMKAYKAIVQRGTIGDDEARYLGGEYERINGRAVNAKANGIKAIAVTSRELPKLMVGPSQSSLVENKLNITNKLKRLENRKT